MAERTVARGGHEGRRVTRRNGAAAALKATLVFLSLLFLVCTALFALIYATQQPSTNVPPLKFELAKALLQVGVVSVSAAIATILVFNYQHRRQADQRALELERDNRRKEDKENADTKARQADYVDELLKGTLSRITGSYNMAKRARRTLNALARHKAAGGTMIRAAVYDEWMAKLNDAQLDLEAVKRDVQVSRGAYPSAREMARGVRKMESYLRDVTKEYEKARRKCAADASIPLEDLAGLSDFLGRKATGATTTRWRSEFTEQYATLRRLVRKNLLHVKFGAAIADQADAAADEESGGS